MKLLAITGIFTSHFIMVNFNAYIRNSRHRVLSIMYANCVACRWIPHPRRRLGITSRTRTATTMMAGAGRVCIYNNICMHVHVGFFYCLACISIPLCDMRYSELRRVAYNDIFGHNFLSFYPFVVLH